MAKETKGSYSKYTVMFPELDQSDIGLYSIFPSGIESLSSTDNVPDLIEKWDIAVKDKSDDVKNSAEWKKLESEYIRHVAWRFSYPRTAFTQRIIVSWLITGLVILLVIAGLIFAAYQLYRAIQLGDVTSLQTELAIETAGRLSISSSIVGVMVLLISLGFFYLFIRHVFGVKQQIPPHIRLRDIDPLRPNKEDSIE